MVYALEAIPPALLYRHPPIMQQLKGLILSFATWGLVKAGFLRPSRIPLLAKGLARQVRMGLAFPESLATRVPVRTAAPHNAAPSARTAAPHKATPPVRTAAPHNAAPSIRTVAPHKAAPSVRTAAPHNAAPSIRTAAPHKATPSARTAAPHNAAPSVRTAAPHKAA